MDNILTWVQPILTTTPKRWINLIDSLPAEMLSQYPAPGEWSPLECLVHILDTERYVFPVRVKAFLTEQAMPAYDPDTQGSQISDDLPSAIDLVSEFARLRTESLALVELLTPDDLKRKSVHAELGPVTLNEMMHEWAAHDLNHTVQAERGMMQPFIRGCGPWQRYCTDHLVMAGEAKP